MAAYVSGLVSTIIPVHNRATLLREAVESVLAQTHRPIEILIVDDGSSDDTPEAIAALASAHPNEIRAFRQENRGPGAARERARREVRGEFIQHLDSDDLLLPGKFELQVAGLEKHPDCDASYGKTRYYARGDEPGNVPLKRTGERIATMFPAFLQSRWWSTCTPLFRRSVIDRTGPWTALRQEEDWEYDCRIAAQGVRLHWCEEFVCDVREHDSDRAHRTPATRLRRLTDRAEAHRLIYGHARRAGIGSEQPEMRHFARELFLLARQCGTAGLPAEARMLFDLAREASGPERARGWDFRLYRWMATGLGWRLAGQLSRVLDRVRGV